jgi:hypothetical protein
MAFPGTGKIITSRIDHAFANHHRLGLSILQECWRFFVSDRRGDASLALGDLRSCAGRRDDSVGRVVVPFFIITSK